MLNRNTRQIVGVNQVSDCVETTSISSHAPRSLTRAVVAPIAATPHFDSSIIEIVESVVSPEAVGSRTEHMSVTFSSLRLGGVWTQ